MKTAVNNEEVVKITSPYQGEFNGSKTAAAKDKDDQWNV